jgi:hypothetical protein
MTCLLCFVHGNSTAKPKPWLSHLVAFDLDQGSALAVQIVMICANHRYSGLGVELGSERTMQDLAQHLLKLRADAEDCDLISKQAIDQNKHSIFATLADHLRRAAADVENAIAEKAGSKRSKAGPAA